jgi:hypothetical protein
MKSKGELDPSSEKAGEFIKAALALCPLDPEWNYQVTSVVENEAANLHFVTIDYNHG